MIGLFVRVEERERHFNWNRIDCYFMVKLFWSRWDWGGCLAGNGIRL